MYLCFCFISYVQWHVSLLDKMDLVSRRRCRRGGSLYLMITTWSFSSTTFFIDRQLDVPPVREKIILARRKTEEGTRLQRALSSTFPPIRELRKLPFQILSISRWTVVLRPVRGKPDRHRASEIAMKLQPRPVLPPRSGNPRRTLPRENSIPSSRTRRDKASLNNHIRYCPHVRGPVTEQSSRVNRVSIIM